MGLNTAKFMQGGRRLNDYEGPHAVQVVSVTEGMTARSRQTKTTIALKVLNSEHPDFASKIAEGKDVSVEVTVLLSEYPDYYFSDLRCFLGACHGEDPADDDFDWDTAFKDACEKDEVNGTMLLAEVYETGKTYTKGKRAGKPVMNIRWEKPEI